MSQSNTLGGSWATPTAYQVHQVREVGDHVVQSTCFVTVTGVEMMIPDREVKPDSNFYDGLHRLRATGRSLLPPSQLCWLHHWSKIKYVCIWHTTRTVQHEATALKISGSFIKWLFASKCLQFVQSENHKVYPTVWLPRSTIPSFVWEGGSFVTMWVAPSSLVSFLDGSIRYTLPLWLTIPYCRCRSTRNISNQLHAVIEWKWRMKQLRTTSPSLTRNTSPLTVFS